MGKPDGKIALITGGSTGIGLATARLFQREGARIILTGRNAAAMPRRRNILFANAISKNLSSTNTSILM